MDWLKSGVENPLYSHSSCQGVKGRFGVDRPDGRGDLPLCKPSVKCEGKVVVVADWLRSGVKNSLHSHSSCQGATWLLLLIG
jgi:hypothetical protein